MSNKMTDTLLVKRFEETKSLDKFLREEIRKQKLPRNVVPVLAGLLSVSPRARTEAAKWCVENVMVILRAEEARKRDRELEKLERQYQKKTGKTSAQTWQEQQIKREEERENEKRRKQNALSGHWELGKRLEKLSDTTLVALGKNSTAIKEFVQAFPDDIQKEITRHWIEEDWEKASDGARRIVGTRNANREYRKEIETQKLNAEKAASFDRMVMALDAISVAGKLLGDCTGGDLIREAVKLEEMAKEATAQSVFYRQLAGIVGKTKTVREASDRAGIVGLLTTHYKEPVSVA